MSLKDALTCNEEEVNLIITETISEYDKNATKVEKLGMLGYGNSSKPFKGFIPLHTRIKYDNICVEDYGMETTDFIYDFVDFARKNKIDNPKDLISSIEYYINNYFGYYSNNSREAIFNDIAWKEAKTDDDYFSRLANNKIGDLKGKNSAQCTERSALAQQLLSLFGFETYYCVGCVDNNGKQEPHCFNILKRKNDYVLMDYSLPITSYNIDGSVKFYYPFMGKLNPEEFTEFINSGVVKTFDDYYYENGKKITTGTQRRYVEGEYEIEEIVHSK